MNSLEEDLAFKLNLVSDFAKFTMHPARETSDVLAHLAHNVLVDMKIEGIAIVAPVDSDVMEFNAVFGRFFSAVEPSPPVLRIFDENPISRAYRFNEITWAQPKVDPTLISTFGKSFENWVEQGEVENIICVPLADEGAPKGVLFLMTSNKIAKSAVTVSFLVTVANLLSVRLHSVIEKVNFLKLENRGDRATHDGATLTDRQMLILSLMAEGSTNALISDNLGYSESTIRQETIKIYSKLKCKGRSEATKIYLEKLKPND
jgi:DNA-binding CsgD family transcriptional regulator